MYGERIKTGSERWNNQDKERLVERRRSRGPPTSDQKSWFRVAKNLWTPSQNITIVRRMDVEICKGQCT